MIWIWVALLSLAAAACVVVPARLPRRTVRPLTPEIEVARALHRDRLRELEGEAIQGTVADSELAEAVAELDARLLEDADAVREKPASGTERRWLPAVVALLVAVCGSGLYGWFGEPSAPVLRGADAVLALADDQHAELARWKQVLEARVAAQPDDAKSWYLLGHARLKASQFSAAAEAFAAAHEASGGDTTIDLYWLQARYLANDRVLDDDSQTIVERILSRSPDHPVVLELLAVEAMRAQRFDLAVGLLNRAAANAGSPQQAAMLAAGLAAARQRSGHPVPAIDVRLSAPESPPPQGSVLFVLARPPGGGMPYAVIRRPLGLLPERIRLDDLVSMTAERKLSSAPHVEVVVRVSLSGSAARNPGDWEWRSDPLALGEQVIQLEAELAPPPAG